MQLRAESHIVTMCDQMCTLLFRDDHGYANSIVSGDVTALG